MDFNELTKTIDCRGNKIAKDLETKSTTFNYLIFDSRCFSIDNEFNELTAFSGCRNTYFESLFHFMFDKLIRKLRTISLTAAALKSDMISNYLNG